jgi:hypothetical protein
MRPTGFALWTWAIGSAMREHAAPLMTAPGEKTPTGPVEIDCGPQIVISPLQGEEPPHLDMSRARVTAAVLIARGSESEREYLPEHQRLDDAVILWDLPEGQATVRVELDHPHVLAGTPTSWSWELDLEPGRSYPVSVDLQPYAGALLVRTTGAAVAAWSPSGQRTVLPVEENRVYLPHLAPGDYRAAVCADAGCGTLRHEWGKVTVRPAEDTRLLDPDF